MKYLIDCGSHFFEGLKKLNSIYSFDSSWFIYSFEANPNTFKQSLIHKPNFQNFKHINAAISNYNGTTTIHCEASQNGCGEGSNILIDPPAKDIQYHHSFSYTSYPVIMYDISSWIDQLEDVDFLVIKMDIEGSEYDVLPRLLDIKTKINVLYIEFHHRFFKDTLLYSKLNNAYVSRLEQQGIKVIIWE